MPASTWITVGYTVGAIIGVFAIWKAYGFKSQKADNDVLRQQNVDLRAGQADLRATNTDLLAKYNTSMSCVNASNVKIAALEGKVSVLESLPLTALATSNQNIDITLQLILDVLKGSARVQADGMKATVIREADVASKLVEHDAAQ